MGKLTHWCIKVTEENREEVGRWFNKNRQNTSVQDFSDKLFFVGKYLHYPIFSNKDFHADTENRVNYTELTTIEQFREVTGSLKSKQPEKKIIGYRLKEIFNHSKVEICRFLMILPLKEDWYIELDGIGCKMAKKLNVLDIWFEPVYEEEKSLHVELLEEPRYKTVCSILAEDLGLRYLELTGHWVNPVTMQLFQCTNRGLNAIGKYNTSVGSFGK